MNEQASLLKEESSDFFKISRTGYLSGGNGFDFNYNATDIEIFHKLKKLYSEVQEKLIQNRFILTRLICFKGSGVKDGHALYLEDEVITFIDLTAYTSHFDRVGFDTYSHLLHEALHGHHYSTNKSFKRSRYVGDVELLYVDALAEGIAVYLAENLNPEGDNYWFGYLDFEKRKDWEKNAESFYELDMEAVKTDLYNDDQKINFLSFADTSIDSLLKGRRAYFFINKFLLQTNLSIDEVVSISPSDFKKLLI